MKLHKYKDEFKSLISIVANKLHIPESAVERDYYIVLLLKKLENSEYVEKCLKAVHHLVNAIQDL